LAKYRIDVLCKHGPSYIRHQVRVHNSNAVSWLKLCAYCMEATRLSKLICYLSTIQKDIARYNLRYSAFQKSEYIESTAQQSYPCEEFVFSKLYVQFTEEYTYIQQQEQIKIAREFS
jgi:hypothetical protein